MAQVTLEELLKGGGSMYKLVILAAKRAIELAEGAPKLAETDAKKLTSMALEEIRQGKVSYEAVEGTEKAAGSSKGKERGAKKDKEKKKSS